MAILSQLVDIGSGRN